ncbi:MAG: DUF1192 domain-containing protein [Alcanivorax sp.]|jgi:uncharacterized small protein (DUF1192 family)
MFDDDLPKAKTGEFPRNLEGLSVAELDEYIVALKDEIKRVEVDISQKKASSEAANAFFK